MAAKKKAKKATKKLAKKAAKAIGKVAKTPAKKVAKAITKVAKAPIKKAAKKAAKAAKAIEKVAKAPIKKAAKATKKAARPKAVVAKPREALELVTVIGASPEDVLAAWLDSAAHSAFTGADAAIDGFAGGKHSAWSGYIEGRFLSIDPGGLAMTWRTTEFAPSDPDSHVELRLTPEAGGARTRLTLVHTGLPEGGAEKYGKGWQDFYFRPMSRYFKG